MDLRNENKVIGFRQSTKIINSGEAGLAYLAADCDEKISIPFKQLCEKNGVPLRLVESMQQLGCLCGIDVGASVVVILK